MARELDEFTPDIQAPDVDNPQGLMLDEGGGDPGSPILADLMNSWINFFGRLMTEAGIVFNDTVDSETSSQFFDALAKRFGESGILWMSAKNLTDVDIFKFDEATNTYHLLADAASTAVDGLVGGALLKLQELLVGSGGIVSEGSGDLLNLKRDNDTTGTAYLVVRATNNSAVGLLGQNTANDDTIVLRSYNDDLVLQTNAGVQLTALHAGGVDIPGDTQMRKLTLDDGGVNSYNPTLDIRRFTAGTEPTVGLRVTIGTNGDRVILPLDSSGSEVSGQNFFYDESATGWAFDSALTVGGDVELSTSGAKLYNSVDDFVGFVGELSRGINTLSSVVFDDLAPYIPNNGDRMLVNGSIAGGVTGIFAVERDDSTTITVYYGTSSEYSLLDDASNIASHGLAF